MAIFRTRAMDAVNRSSALDAPLLLPRPQLRRRWRSNWIQLRQALLPSKSGRVVRTTELRQQDPTECGAVSLSIVLQHHGCHMPLSGLRRACGVSRDGSDAANLVRAAKLFGLEAKGFKKGLQALNSVSLPAIVFWNFDHFLVLEGLEEGRYWLNDPASGHRCVDLEEFDRCYTGVVLTMQPGPAFQPTPAPPTALQQLWRWLREEPRARWLPVLVCSLAAAALLSLIPAGQLPPWPVGLGLVALALALQPMAQRLSRAVQRRRSAGLMQRLIHLPDWVLQQFFSAELSARQQLVPPLAGFLETKGWPALPWLLASLIWGLLLLPQAAPLSLLIWAGSAAWAWSVLWSEQRQRSSDAQERMASQRPNSVLRGGLQDPETLKASALERDLFVRWAGLDALAARDRQRLAYSRDLLEWLPQLLGWSLPVVLVAAGLGLRQPAVAVIATGLGLALAQQRCSLALRQWADARAAIGGLASIEEQPTDPWLRDPPSIGAPPQGPARLELENVSFGYVPVQPPLIEAFSLVAEPGQRIAIVGGSASGKSTVARLIAGLLQPTAGVVKLNGRPLMEWPREQRLRAIAMVQQGLPLLSCSVRDNLTFWNRRIHQEQLDEACTAAGILERIQRLPQGFNTPLGPAGQILSGGERQRLQIAQALIQQPSLLILDEATSALDARTEQAVESALRQLPCTQVVVAHRLSTIRDADLILVMKQGKMVQSGTHASMACEPKSFYNELLALDDSTSRLNEDSPPAAVEEA